jgi:hypothetical protein
MIKNNSDCDIFLDYDCPNVVSPDNKSVVFRKLQQPSLSLVGSHLKQAINEAAEKYRKLKIFLENNYYDIGKNFYYKNYNEYYVNKIKL